jgi:hypothetical protein
MQYRKAGSLCTSCGLLKAVTEPENEGTAYAVQYDGGPEKLALSSVARGRRDAVHDLTSSSSAAACIQHCHHIAYTHASI